MSRVFNPPPLSGFTTYNHSNTPAHLSVSIQQFYGEISNGVLALAAQFSVSPL